MSQSCVFSFIVKELVFKLAMLLHLQDQRRQGDLLEAPTVHIEALQTASCLPRSRRYNQDWRFTPRRVLANRTAKNRFQHVLQTFITN